MSIEANKQLARDYFQAFLKKDTRWFAAHVASGFRRHDPGLPFEVVGPKGVERLADALLPAIPDMRLDIEDVVAEGEKVLVRLWIHGHQSGELFGIPPTGKPIEVAVLDLFQIRDGQLIEHWALLDNLGMLKQLGITSI